MISNQGRSDEDEIGVHYAKVKKSSDAIKDPKYNIGLKDSRFPRPLENENMREEQKNNYVNYYPEIDKPSAAANGGNSVEGGTGLSSVISNDYLTAINIPN